MVLVADEEPVATVESDQERADVVVSAVDEGCCRRQSPHVHSPQAVAYWNTSSPEVLPRVVFLWADSEAKAVEALFLDLEPGPEQPLEHCYQTVLTSVFVEVTISFGRTAVLTVDVFDLGEGAFALVD